MSIGNVLKANMKLLTMSLLVSYMFQSRAWAHINIEQIIGNTMGTTYTIQLRLQNNLATKQQIKALVEQELEQLNSTLSVYRLDSEISILYYVFQRRYLRKPMERSM
jgi:thiamine biosynthesis lipoprotein